MLAVRISSAALCLDLNIKMQKIVVGAPLTIVPIKMPHDTKSKASPFALSISPTFFNLLYLLSFFTVRDRSFTLSFSSRTRDLVVRPKLTHYQTKRHSFFTLST